MRITRPPSTWKIQGKTKSPQIFHLAPRPCIQSRPTRGTPLWNPPAKPSFSVKYITHYICRNQMDCVRIYLSKCVKFLKGVNLNTRG